MPRKSRKEPVDLLHYTWTRWQNWHWTMSPYSSWEDMLEASYRAFIEGSCVTGSVEERANPDRELYHPGVPHFFGSVHSGQDRLMESWNAWLEAHPDKRLDEGDMSREERLAKAIAVHVPPKEAIDANTRRVAAALQPIFARIFERMEAEGKLDEPPTESF